MASGGGGASPEEFNLMEYISQEESIQIYNKYSAQYGDSISVAQNAVLTNVVIERTNAEMRQLANKRKLAARNRASRDGQRLAMEASERRARFDTGTILNAPSNGLYTVQAEGREIVPGSQDAARTKVGTMGNCELRPGDTAVLLGSQSNDQPMILGQSPWVTG